MQCLKELKRQNTTWQIQIRPT